MLKKGKKKPQHIFWGVGGREGLEDLTISDCLVKNINRVY